MPGKKKNLQTAKPTPYPPVKPVPPDDMWEQMGQALDEINSHVEPKPPGAFTRGEFQQKFQLSETAAALRIRKLLMAGKIKRFGSTGRNVYYTMV